MNSQLGPKKVVIKGGGVYAQMKKGFNVENGEKEARVKPHERGKFFTNRGCGRPNAAPGGSKKGGPVS